MSESEQVARNNLQAVSEIGDRVVANWLLPKLTSSEVEQLGTSSVPPAELVRSIAAGALRRAADEIVPLRNPPA